MITFNQIHRWTRYSILDLGELKCYETYFLIENKKQDYGYHYLDITKVAYYCNYAKGYAAGGFYLQFIIPNREYYTMFRLDSNCYLKNWFLIPYTGDCTFSLF